MEEGEGRQGNGGVQTNCYTTAILACLAFVFIQDIKLEGDLCNYVQFQEEFTRKLDLSDAEPSKLLL